MNTSVSAFPSSGTAAKEIENASFGYTGGADTDTKSDFIPLVKVTNKQVTGIVRDFSYLFQIVHATVQHYTLDRRYFRHLIDHQGKGPQYILHTTSHEGRIVVKSQLPGDTSAGPSSRLGSWSISPFRRQNSDECWSVSETGSDLLTQVHVQVPRHESADQHWNSPAHRLRPYPNRHQRSGSRNAASHPRHGHHCQRGRRVVHSTSRRVVAATTGRGWDHICLTEVQRRRRIYKHKYRRRHDTAPTGILEPSDAEGEGEGVVRISTMDTSPKVYCLLNLGNRRRKFVDHIWDRPGYDWEFISV
ncbi:hypothetical protein Hypma_005875 [Hypsizygus marmoreus]|uniref:Uncharacterized protein n=1 Tax=Hypsizygus marmoreus TaxID=39966 RepID=A0A369K7M7_HYPMA|nr:hypothetical protein Hypma_005875 [Hypsizygus marmoreus]